MKSNKIHCSSIILKKHLDNGPVLYIKEYPKPKEMRHINEKYEEGNYICLFTARTEALKKITEDKLNSIGLKYHQLMLNKPRLRHTEFKGYHYIDNCAVLKSSRFEGVWSDLVEKDLKITVFDNEKLG